MKSRYGHVFNGRGSFKRGQFKSNLSCMRRLNPRCAAGLKKTAQSFVPKRLDHLPSISCCALRINQHCCCITTALTGERQRVRVERMVMGFYNNQYLLLCRANSNTCLPIANCSIRVLPLSVLFRLDNNCLNVTGASFLTNSGWIHEYQLTIVDISGVS